jgi:D-alanyl-D-alanine carboxypeptidase
MPFTFSRRRLLSIGLFLTMSLAVASRPIRAQAPPPDVASDADVQAAQRLFTAWLEGQMLSRHLPGIAIGVVADQELVWSKGFGLADTASKVAMTPQTKFRMASHSKLFTATAIMQLRERGLLRLDDPVAKHLPWFAVTPAEAEDAPITIEELLTHSSGLPREAGSHWTTFEFPTTEQLRKLMAARHAPYSPEVRWK